MKVVIMGSGGFVGRHLVRFLQEKGIDTQGFSSSLPGGIDPNTGVLSDEFMIQGGTTDTVVYLAQSPFYNQAPEMAMHLINVNLVSLLKVADLARKAKVKRFVYASTGNVYAPSFEPLSENSALRRDNWYSLSKIHGEEALSLYNNDMDIIVVRPFGIYGPGQTGKLVPKLLDSVIHNRAISVNRNPHDIDDLDGLRISLCYIDDMVEILYRLSTSGGPSYLNVAGDKAVSIRQIAMLMAEYLKRDVEFKIVEESRDFNLIADISLLKKALNPKFTEFHEGIRKTVDNEVNKVIFSG